MISYKYVLIYAVFRLFAALARRKRSKAVGRDDMKSMKKNSIISLALICVFSLLLTVTVGGVKAFAVAPTAAEAQAYYEENKAKVEPIDNGAAFFAKMRDAYVDTGDTGAYDSMVSLVKVAEKATEYKDAYVALKYPLKDRETVIKEVNLALNAVKAASENYLKYSEKETKYLERLEELKTKLDKLKTKQVLFDEAKSAAKTTLEAKRDELLSVSGTPTTTVGALDAIAKTAIGDAASEYLAKIEAVTYTTDITDEKDDEKYLKAVVEADDMSKAGKVAVIAVPKNDVERTYNDLSDYEAMRDGYVGKKDGETDEQFAARKAALKDKVVASIEALNEIFFPNASKDVLKEYSTEKQHFDNFIKGYNSDNKLGHMESNWIIDVNPSCETLGSKHLFCTICNEILKVEIISVLGHDYSEAWTVDKEASCTESGSKSHHCTRCSAKTGVTEIAATGHTEAIDSAKEATCTETGLTEGKYCSVCGRVLKKQEVIAKKAHTESEWIMDSKAGCETAGAKHKECAVCKEILKIESIAAEGHTAGEYIVDYDSTCKSAGSKHKECRKCGKVLEKAQIAAKGHEYGEWNVDVEPTVNAEGREYRKCVRCEHREERSVEKLKGGCGGSIYADGGLFEIILALAVSVVTVIAKNIKPDNNFKK